MDLQMTVAPILNFGSLSLNLAEEPWKTQGLRALIAGSSGSGKSHTMNIWCEELQAIGAPFLVIDPDDEYAGLKALPGVIVCGPEGDIRLGSRTWRADVVKAMLDQGAGVVLDLSGLPGLDEQREMYVGVTARLFDAQRARKKAGADLDVVFLLLEEAHIFAPAKNASRAKESIDATYQLARRGRKFGVNLVASTQRPRDLYTDVRSQFNARFIGRLDDDIDHEAVRTYLPSHIRHSSLLRLPTGQFYWTQKGIFELIKVRPRRTRDLGSTPQVKYRQRTLFEAPNS